MKTLLRLPKRFYNWGLCYRDSTRSVGLIRIGLVLLIWSEWGGRLIFCRDIRLGAILLNSAFFLLTGLMCVGLWTRASSMGTAIIVSIMFNIHQPFRHHHTFLLVMAIFFIALTPCGRSYSLDRWLALRRALKSGLPPPPEIGNLWGLRLIAIQLSMVYFWTAYEKLYWGFLSGARMELLAYNYYAGYDYASIPGFSALCFIAAITTVILEFLLSFGLYLPKLRKYLMPVGIVLHIFFYVLLPIRTFTLTMILLYLAFIPAASVHRFIDNMHEGYPSA